jgi:hypothetical protein
MIDGNVSILHFAICASALRRQAIFAALSCFDENSSGDFADKLYRFHPEFSWHNNPAKDIAIALTSWRVRDIVEVAFRGVHDGILGALGKIGFKPFVDPKTYCKLHYLLSGAAGAERAKMLRQATRITSTMVAVAAVLDPALCRVSVIEKIGQVQHAIGLNHVAELARLLSDATDEDLVASIPDDGQWDDWARRWVGKAKRFLVTPPICDDDEIRGLNTAQMMRDAARRFSNCLETKIPAVAVGRTFYLEFTPDPAIIELVSFSSDKWALSGISGVKNAKPEPSTVKTIWEKLEPVGVLIPASHAHGEKWNPAAKVMRTWEFGPDCEMDFDLSGLERIG